MRLVQSVYKPLLWLINIFYVCEERRNIFTFKTFLAESQIRCCGLSMDCSVSWRHWPPEKDCARTSAVKAVLGLALAALRSSCCWCSLSTCRQRPYRKLCRMSEVMMSAREDAGCGLKAAFRPSDEPGKTDPMLVTRGTRSRGTESRRTWSRGAKEPNP